MWYIHAIHYYKAIKMNTQQQHMTTCMNLTTLMLNKRIHVIAFHLYKFQKQAKLNCVAWRCMHSGKNIKNKEITIKIRILVSSREREAIVVWSNS